MRITQATRLAMAQARKLILVIEVKRVSGRDGSRQPLLLDGNVGTADIVNKKGIPWKGVMADIYLFGQALHKAYKRSLCVTPG